MGDHEPDGRADDWFSEEIRAWLLAEARRLLSRRLLGKIGPEDLVQKTFHKAILRRAQFQGGANKAQWRGWLRVILRNTLLDEIDKRLKDIPFSDLVEQSSIILEDMLTDDGSSPSARALSAEQRERLAAALAQLPPAWRSALELIHWGGYSTAEAARIMGVTRGTVAGMTRSAYRRLRKLMSPPKGGVS